MRIQLLVLFASLLGSACVIRNHCTPNNCNGCCDTTGMCLDGNTADACGARGGACQACMGAACSAGVCLGAGGGLAGGLGGGPSGGGAAGGASGGGVAGPTWSVILLWNFAGQTCAQAAVSNVVVNLPNTPVRNQAFRCNTSGTDGVVLQGIAAGNYTATLEGRDATNTLRFRGTTQVRVVDQDVSAQVRLERVSTGPGELVVKWTFPPLATSNSPTCAQAGISKVSVAVNGGTAREVSCTTGEAAGAGVRFTNVSGAVTLDVAAADANGFVYFRKREQVTVSGPTPFTTALDWDVGSLPVRWEFRDGMVLTCAQAGVTSIYLNLRTTVGQPTLLYPNAGAEVPCSDAMTGQATVFPYLPQGTFDVFFQAVGAGGKLYKTNQTMPPQVTVRAGQFPGLTAQTPTYTLTP